MPDTAAVAWLYDSAGVRRCARPFDLPEPEYQSWLETQSIGGSQIGAVIGCSDWGTPAKVFDTLLGLAPPDDPNHDMARGTAMEALIADIYTEKTGRDLILQDMRQRSSVWPFLHASPDRMIGPCDDPSHPTREVAPDSGPGILEIKCPRWRGFDRVRVDGIAPAYYAQLQMYLFITGLRWGSFAVFNADAWELYWFDVLRDDPFIEQMVNRAVCFWRDHMVPRVRPGPRRDPIIPPERVGAEAVFCDAPEFRAAVDALRRAQADHQAFQRSYEDARERVRALIGAAEAVVGPGVRITHRAQTRTTYDMEALYREHPEINLAEYRRQTATGPVLRVTFNGS